MGRRWCRANNDRRCHRRRRHCERATSPRRMRRAHRMRQSWARAIATRTLETQLDCSLRPRLDSATNDE